jgi:hypothetical protein
VDSVAIAHPLDVKEADLERPVRLAVNEVLRDGKRR